MAHVQITSFPACFVLGFMDNHFLLQRARPKWRTLKNRSEDYVAKLHQALEEAGSRVCDSAQN